MNKIRLIALDMDGTLVNDKKTVSARNLEALRAAMSAGIYIVPATGRTSGTLPQELLSLPGIRYVISCNGAKVTDLKENRSLFSQNIPQPVMLDIMEKARDFDCVREVSVNDILYLAEDDDEKELSYVPPHYAPFMRVMRQCTPSLNPVMAGASGGAEKLLIFFTHEKDKVRFREYLKQYEVEVSSSLSSNLEINAAGVSKGRALRALAEHLQLQPDELVAAGDSENDKTMLRYVGFPIAMGNALPEIQRMARHVTLTCDEDGVAAAIEHILRENGTAG